MKITITVKFWTEIVIRLNVDESVLLEDFKVLSLLEAGEQIPPSSYHIFIVHGSRNLFGDKLTLKEHGLKNGDFVKLELIKIGTNTDDMDTAGARKVPKDDATFIREQLLKYPEQLEHLKKTNPPMAEALLAEEFESFSNQIEMILSGYTTERDAKLKKILRENQDLKNNNYLGATTSRNCRTDLTNNNNTYDTDQQDIQIASKKYVNYGGQSLLYVKVKVNGLPVKTIVDTGSPMTTMSKFCANRVKLSEPKLTSPGKMGYASAAQNIKSPGKFQTCNIEIVGEFFVTNLTVVENQKMELILGLDMLKRHGCLIDLRKNMLKIGSSGCETPFISESSAKTFF